MKGKPIAWLYFFTGVMHLLALLIGSEYLSSWTKPILMPLLIAYVYIDTSQKLNLTVKFLIAALVLSWFGDIALMLTYWPAGFIAGLGSFMVAHVMYAIAFTRAVWNPIRFKANVVWPLVLYGFVFLIFILPESGLLGVPVIVYSLVLLVMTGCTWLRNGKTSAESYLIGIGGSVLFVISDSLLAVYRFLGEFSLGQFFIMITYIAAQFLLTKSLLTHSEDQSA